MIKKRGDTVKAKIVIMAAFLSISIASSFANKNALTPVEYEKSDIEALEDEVIRKINETGPRSELSRDVTGSDIDFDRAYRVYANSKLFGKRTDDANEIKAILQNGQYLWQVPVFIDNDTVLVDIYKNAEDEVKDKLQETAGQWQVGAMYVYDNRTVDYQETVRESLAAAALEADEYTYEFVSGLPGIRYPVAIIFDQSEAKYIIPAESATARAFEKGSETMEYTAASSGENREARGENVFPVYKFADVSRASRNGSLFGLGSGIGISPYNVVKRNACIAILIIGGVGVVRKRRGKTRGK